MGNINGMTFTASLLGSKGHFWLCLCIVSSTEMWVNEKCHLNLVFCRMWLKWSTILKYMPLTHVSACRSVRRRMPETARILSYLLKVRWLSQGKPLARVLNYDNCSEISFKTVTTGSTFQWHDGSKACLFVWHTTCTVNSICHFRRGQQLCKSQQIKWLHSKANWKYGGNESEHWDLTHFRH